MASREGDRNKSKEFSELYVTRRPLQRRAKVAGIAAVLLAVISLPPLMRAPATRPGSDGQQAAIPAAPPKFGVPQPFPDAAPYPFLRLVTVLLSGFVISAAHLARKFRRFWGLGVFANPYAPVFLIFGVGLCGIPVTSETTLSSVPHVGFLGPWIADLSGIVIWLILPAIRFKSQPGREGQVRDLAGAASSNPIFAVIEDAIRDRILARMQSEVVRASLQYNWNAIKVAARRALEEEMTIGRLGREEGESVLQTIEAFQADADARRDSNNKYTALLRLLGSCSFSRLRDSLAAAARESGS